MAKVSDLVPSLPSGLTIMYFYIIIERIAMTFNSVCTFTLMLTQPRTILSICTSVYELQLSQYLFIHHIVFSYIADCRKNMFGS